MLSPAEAGRSHRITFIGEGGRPLGALTGASARRPLSLAKGYVRAKITDDLGRAAWTQPAWAEAPRP